jgi:hypothetical protein
MRQSMSYEQPEYNEGEGFDPREQERPSAIHQYTSTQGEKIFEINLKIGQRIVAAGVSLILWCLFTFTIFVAYGVANVSPSPAAHTTQILLTVGFFIFTIFVLWANILFNKLLSKKAK